MNPNTWYEVDITSLITGDGSYSLRITAASTDGADYYSKEGGYAPELVVTTGQAGGMRGLELSKARRKSGLAKRMATKQGQSGLELVGAGELTDYLFTGQRFEEELGLYWYGSRWYDPSIMRWTSPDPIIPGVGEGGNANAVGCMGAANYSPLTVDYHENQLLEQLNNENRTVLQDPTFRLPPVPANPIAFDRYAYSLNNPVRYTDPTGHCPFCPALAAVPVVGWVALGVTAVGVVVYFTVPGVREAVTAGIYNAGEAASNGLNALFAKGEYVPPGLFGAERNANREAFHAYKRAWGLGPKDNVPKRILDGIADKIKKGLKPGDAADAVDGPPEADEED